MLGIFEAQFICYLCNAFTGGEFVFCPLDDILTDIVACRVARHSLDHIPEIVGRHAQFVGAILHGRYAKRQLQLFLIIIPKQVLEFREYVRVLQLSGNELTVVKTPAEIENQSDILHKNGILELIAFFMQFVLYLPYQRHQNVVLLVGHVQGFVDPVIEKGISLYLLFQRGSVQQVGMEKQCPACDRHALPVIFLTSDLSGSNAQ